MSEARIIIEAELEAELDDHDIIHVVRWEGGHGLRLYSREGEELAYRTVGDMSRDLTHEEARAEVQAWADWINSGDRAALEF